MNKKSLVFIAVYIVSFIAAVVMMISQEGIRWEVIAAGIVCGGYGIKRILDDSTIGYILLGLCILLMAVMIFGISL